MKKLFAIVIILTVVVCLFAACAKEDVTITSVTLSGNYKTDYKVGDEIDLTGMYVTVNYSDGSQEILPVSEGMFDAAQFNTNSEAASKSLRIVYQNFTAILKYSVSPADIVSRITEVRLVDMPESIYFNAELPLDGDGYLKTGKAVVTVKDVGEVELRIKGIWIKNFSTSKVGSKKADVTVVTDYGDVTATWEYTVLQLPAAKTVTYDKAISVYLDDSTAELSSALSGVKFRVEYENGDVAEYVYDSTFKVSGFSSSELGEKSCTISFTDSERRTIKATLEYTVKVPYPVYTVTFNENYEEGAVFDVQTKDGLVANPDARRTGWVFIGWYDEDNAKFDFTAIVESDITLTAKWQKANYTISFYDDKGNFMGNATYDVDDEKPLPRPAQLPNYTAPAGYVFSHYTDYGGATITGIRKGTTGDMVLTAHFTAIEYTVTYVLSDGVDTPATNLNAETFSQDAPIDFEDAVRRGFTFEGWFYNNQAITTTKNICTNITVTAKWTENEYTLTRVNGLTDEVIDVIKFKVTDSDTLISNYEVPSFKFYGWFTDKSYSASSEYSKTSEGRYKIPARSSGDVTLYAKLETCYTLSLDTLILDGINPKVINVTFVENDDKVTLLIPTRPGCTFTNWRNLDLNLTYSNEDDLVGETEAIDIATAPIIELIVSNKLRDNTLPLIAYYDVHSHVIRHHFYTDFDGVEYIREVEYETTVRKNLLVPADSAFIPRNGFNFVDWYRDPEYKTSRVEYIEAETADEDIDVYAKWSAITYTITLHYNKEDDGYLVKADIPATYTANDEFTLKVPSYPNYNFEGWFDDEEFLSHHPTDIRKGNYGNMVLYAKWTPVTYIMTLKNMENAVYPGLRAYTLEDEIVVLETPTKTGYNFGGWYKESTFIHKVTSFVPAEVGANYTAWAKWDVKTYTVNYVYNDSEDFPASSENPASFLYGASPDLEDATRNGYDFISWYSRPAVNGTFNEVYAINALSVSLANENDEITVYAEWIKGEYSITYVCEEADVSSLPTKYTIDGMRVGSKYTYTLPLPTRAHYVCVWTLDGESITDLGGEGFVYRDITLTATWTPVNYALTFRVNGKTGVLNYNAEDFVNGVYVLPTYEELLTAGVFAENSLVGKYVEYWKIGTTETSEITIDKLNKYTLDGSLANTVYHLTYSLPDGATLIEGATGQNPETFTYNTTIKVTSAELTGYVFDAWYTDAEFVNKAGTVSSGITSIKTPADDLTLYAKFAVIRTITYVDAEGMTLSGKVETYTELASKPLGNPTKTGYNFGGWWCLTLNKNVTETADFGSTDNVRVQPLFYESKTNGVSNTANLRFSLSGSNATLSSIGSVSGKLVIPASVSGYTVTKIAAAVFSGNKSITSVTIDENILEVGNRAFENCTAITSLVIKGSAIIKNEAFNGCSALKTIEISADATVNENVFSGCSKVETLTYDGTNGSNQLAVYRLFGGAATYDGNYVPATLTTFYFNGSDSLKGILLHCESITKLYILSDEQVTITGTDLTVLNGKTVYVKTQALADAYSVSYSGVTFAVA
ncbi:MAG: InlB B-repeat-containing protein [Clostridia bacterium]|nr:InlB B-repeat-containing protein [Clostridia bacterium]